MHFSPGGLGCCPFKGGVSVVVVVVESLLYVPPIVCVGSVFVFVLLCITSVLSGFSIILTRKRELVAVL